MKKDNDIPTQSAEESASEEHQVRVEKVKAMRKANINPWPESKPVDATAHEVLSSLKKMRNLVNMPLRGALFHCASMAKQYLGICRIVAARYRFMFARMLLVKLRLGTLKTLLMLAICFGCKVMHLKPKWAR